MSSEIALTNSNTQWKTVYAKVRSDQNTLAIRDISDTQYTHRKLNTTASNNVHTSLVLKQCILLYYSAFFTFLLVFAMLFDLIAKQKEINRSTTHYVQTQYKSTYFLLPQVCDKSLSFSDGLTE